MENQKALQVPAEKLAELEECIVGMYEFGCSGHVLVNAQRLVEELKNTVEADALRLALKDAMRKCDATHGMGACIHTQHSLRMGDVEQTIREILP